MNEEDRERGKLMIIQLACGHFQRFRGILTCPVENELVYCTQCPKSNGPVIVRSSPRAGPKFICTCQDCGWVRKMHGRLAGAKLFASGHAQRNSHLVIVAKSGQEVHRSDWRQEAIDFNGPPPF